MADTELMNFIQEDLKKYDGIRMPLKAGLLERLLVRRARCSKLHPNPDDEFCMPSIGPNYGIISDYAFKIKSGKYWGEDIQAEPLYVEKMYPHGYMILNGHHRWAAMLRLKRWLIPVQIVNVTTDADIDNILKRTSSQKRVSFDLDEVVFCDDGVSEKKPFFVHGPVKKERIRLGMPALTHYLAQNGYDIWAYTQKYYSDDDIRRYLRACHVKVHGVITGYSRKRWTKNKLGEQIEKKIMEKYHTTLNITNDEIIKIEKKSGGFEQYDLNCDAADWSKSVMNIIKSWHDEER